MFFYTSPQSIIITFSYTLAYQLCGLLLNFAWLVYLTFQPPIVIFRRANFVYHQWECTWIFRPLSYPFRSVKVYCIHQNGRDSWKFKRRNNYLQPNVMSLSQLRKKNFLFGSFQSENLKIKLFLFSKNIKIYVLYCIIGSKQILTLFLRQIFNS